MSAECGVRNAERLSDEALVWLAAEAKYQATQAAAMTMSVLTVQQLVAELQERRAAAPS